MNTAFKINLAQMWGRWRQQIGQLKAIVEVLAFVMSDDFTQKYDWQYHTVSIV